MSCHKILEEWIGVQTAYGKIINAYTMLNPQNDMFVIENWMGIGKSRKVRRSELFSGSNDS